MSSGFTVQSQGGKDLDDIFDPYQGGTKPAATGYTVGSQDLKDRYNPISEGDAAPATHMDVQGVGDLNQIFAAKGTSTKAIVIPFGNYSASSHGSHDVGAGFDLALHADGTWDISLTFLHSGGTGGTPLHGSWCKDPVSGIGADYEVRFVAHITISNTGSASGGSYTASTGWLSLGSDAGVSADTGHILSGGSSDSGSSGVGGYWYVDIRKVGSSVIRRSSCNINLQAISI